MKTVLLSTLGGSCKTVTEMYQALKWQKVDIEEIHVITTKGSNTVPEKFRPNVIWTEHLLNSLDVKNKADAEDMGNLIFKTLASLKNRNDIERVILDITGGRKTMSIYLLTSAQLLCSEDDQMYQVITNDPELANPKSDLYYPGTPEDITLISVPFVSLKKLFQVGNGLHNNSLWKFSKTGSDILQNLAICGLMAQGIEHETAGLFLNAKEEAPQIINILNRIEGITQSFYAVLKGKETKLKKLNIKDILNKLKSLIHEEININVKIDSRDTYIMANEILLLHIFFIITKNARNHGIAENMIIKNRILNNRIILEFEDDGKGIAEKAKKEAFSPFKTYKYENAGKQVGLPVCKKILKIFEGTITIDNGIQKGTVVTVTLPIVK